MNEIGMVDKKFNIHTIEMRCLQKTVVYNLLFKTQQLLTTPNGFGI